jgi:Tol biopolymer transport system component
MMEAKNMKGVSSKVVCVVVFWLTVLVTHPVAAEKLQLISAIDVSQSPAAGGNGDSLTPIISADGRYVLFSSSANNLLTLANGNPIPAFRVPMMNVFVRDRTNGTTTLVSVNAAGNAGGNGNSLPDAVSANGRFVLFESSASDLISDDTNGVNDIFLRDLVSGQTWLVSTNSTGGVANGESRSPVMTPDARYIAFVSVATNLTAVDTNTIADVFLRDMQAGTTILVSVGATATNTTPLAGSSENPEISADGRFVAFQSTATNLVPAVATSGDIYVRDTVTGLTAQASADARALFGDKRCLL